MNAEMEEWCRQQLEDWTAVRPAEPPLPRNALPRDERRPSPERELPQHLIHLAAGIHLLRNQGATDFQIVRLVTRLLETPTVSVQATVAHGPNCKRRPATQTQKGNVIPDHVTLAVNHLHEPADNFDCCDGCRAIRPQPQGQEPTPRVRITHAAAPHA
jgi:hypothetical protein